MNFTQKLLYVMMLTLFIISIVYSYNVSDVDAEVNRTQELTVQSNLAVIEFQPPVDTNTSQRIELPGNLIGINDPNIGQMNSRDIKFVPPISKDVIIGNRTPLNETNPKLATKSTTAIPTFNPPLKRCSTTEDDKRKGLDDGFDFSKYMITGKFDKDKLKGNDFDFQIFSDLVKDDEAETKGNHAPYKANFVTDQDNKTKVELEEIATMCIDIQDVVNLKK